MEALADFVNLYFLPGVAVGCIYALGAVGISLIFAILRFAHFAHGDVMTFGAYVAYSLVASLGWSVYLALPIAIIAAAFLGVAVDRLAYKPFRKSPGIIVVIASFGVMLVVRSLIQLIWGVDVLNYETGIRKPIELFGGFRIAQKHIIIILVSVIIAAGLHWFLSRSRMGKAMRAMSDDADLARISGIDTERVVRWTWLIGGGLAAAAGVFAGINSKLHPSVGWDLLLPLFAAAILGGIGKPYGAIVGGLAIGIAQEVATYPWIADMPLVPPAYKNAVAFFVMVCMLIWRPTGLFRGRVL
ncbi:MAG: branched-chain amino acid ABC transporter permease [Proteobacteria bacterium]|nr:branched-chain amino acid ABC transporter permease [Pseudomonadota bacterium]